VVSIDGDFQEAFTNKKEANLYKSRKEKLFDLALKKDPDKITELGQDVLKYDAWVIPDLETLKREYHIEHELKGHNYFNSLEEFLEAIKNATIETINSELDYTTKTKLDFSRFKILPTITVGSIPPSIRAVASMPVTVVLP
jgi:hypothetical protein